MIPLTTKLPAICSLLQRVLEMEEKEEPDWSVSEIDPFEIVTENGLIAVCERSRTTPFLTLARNISKPQATALLLAISALDKNYQAFRTGNWMGYANDALADLQAIADAFPDALFPSIQPRPINDPYFLTDPR